MNSIFIIIIIIIIGSLTLSTEFMGTRRHAQFFRFWSFIIAFWTWNRCILFIFKALAFNVIVTIARFAPQTWKLTMFIARLTFIIFRLEHLTWGLMFELIIFTEKSAAEGAVKHPSTKLIDASFAFDAYSINQWTSTSMAL